MHFDIVCAEVTAWAQEYDGPKFHTLLCDPPYHLTGGFMGRYWDKDGPDAIAFQPETWAALAEHLYPGGFVMAFASSRGWHRLACAMEDAGLVIAPSIFIWLNSQSFPKSTRIDMQLDKHRYDINVVSNWLKSLGSREEVAEAADVTSRQVDHWIGENTPCPQYLTEERFRKICSHFNVWPEWADDALEKLGAKLGEVTYSRSGGEDYPKVPGSNAFTRTIDIHAPATDLARAWEGHRYGGQILKNCAEPIICAQKPWTEPRLDCIVETGAGALWVDGGRIGTEETLRQGSQRGVGEYDGWHFQLGVSNQHPQGRWPPNFALVHQSPSPDGSPGCRRAGVKKVKHEGGTGKASEHNNGALFGSTNHKRYWYANSDGKETVPNWKCVDGCVCKKLGEQAGERKSGSGNKSHPESNQYGGVALLPSTTKGDGKHWEGDSGGASRFYFQAGWEYEIAEQLAASDPVHYCPKAAKSERQAGLDDFFWRKDKDSPTGFMRIDRDEWDALGEEEQRIKAETGKRISLRAQGNIHPTQKPISLNKWLATLLLPPKEYAPRRIMVPFAGKGSEMIGAMFAGWDEIVAIEMIQDYCDAGQARMQFWASQSHQLELSL